MILELIIKWQTLTTYMANAISDFEQHVCHIEVGISFRTPFK